MLTRVKAESETRNENTNSPEFIEKQVDERGFYLYEWISKDELRMSILADYLSIIRSSSIPLALVTIVFGFLGLIGGGIGGVILAVLGILGIFYTIVVIILIGKMFRKSYLYTRGANVVITDHNYVSAGKVVDRSDFREQKEAFAELEKTFREPLLESSGLAEHIEMEKKSLFDQLGSIASGGGQFMQSFGRSRDAEGIILVLMIAGVLYGGMMAIVYFLGVFFVAFLARIFSWIANQALLIANNTEHEIQTLFGKIYESSVALKEGQKDSISLLTEASQNAWADNLSGKLKESFELIGKMAENATNDTVKLRNLLESSQYKDIFNFVKYGNWIKTQVIEPIDDIYILLEKNKNTIDTTISELEEQISTTKDPSLQKPLTLQKDRLELQKENFETVMKMLEGYQEKLKK